MEESQELMDPTEAIPMSATALSYDKKAYTYIWFLVEPSSQDLIIKIKSG
jgi:hypothetical protein